MLLATAAVFAALGGISPFGLTEPWDVSMLALGLAALAGLAVVLRRARGPQPALPVVASLGGLVAVATVAAVRADVSRDALLGAPPSALGAAQVAAVMALVFIAARLGYLALRPALRRAAAVLVLFQATFVASQAIAGLELTGTSNPSFVSQIVALCLPLLVGLPGHEPSDRPVIPVWRWAVAGIGVVLVAVVGARFGLLVVAVEAGLLLALWYRRVPAGSGLRRRVSRFALGFLAALAAGAALIWDRVTEAVSLGADALGSRPELWSAAVDVIRGAPLLGVGPDGYRTAIARTVDPGFFRLEGRLASGFNALPSDPHNVILHVAVSLGAIGLVVAIALAVSIVRSWRAEGVWSDGRGALAIASTAYVATLMLAPGTIQTLALWAIVLGASLASYTHAEEATRGRRALARVPLALLGTAGALALVAVSATHLWVGRLQVVEGSSADRTAAADRAEVAAGLWGSDPLLHYAAGWRWHEEALATGIPADWDRALDSSRRARGLAPREPIYALDTAMTLEGAGAAPQEVLEAYDRAIEAFPWSVEANEHHARYLLSIGRHPEAESSIDRALEVAGGLSRLHELAAIIHRAQGEEAEALEHDASAARGR